MTIRGGARAFVAAWKERQQRIDPEKNPGRGRGLHEKRTGLFWFGYRTMLTAVLSSSAEVVMVLELAL